VKADVVLKVIVGVFLVALVAAAGFYAGKIVSDGAQEPSSGAVSGEPIPENDEKPMSDLARRVLALEKVTDVIDGWGEDEVLLFVIVDAEGVGDGERDVFLEGLDAAIGPDIDPQRIVLVNRSGGRLLRWHIEREAREDPS